MSERFDPPNLFAIDMRHILDAVNLNIQAVADSASKLLQPQLNRLRESVEGTLRTAFETLGAVVEQAEAASPEIAEPLTRAGFWLFPSAPISMSLAVRALVHEGQATAQNVRQLVVRWYRLDDCSLLKTMVEGWQGNPHFARRMDIIMDALRAHIDARYTLSIPTLLPIVEGILTSVTGKPAARSGGSIPLARGVIEGMYTDFMREASKDAVIEFVTGMRVYGNVPQQYFTPQRYPEWLAQHGLTGDQVLNRHAILHGVQMDYGSEENSLRAFFILDVLSRLEGEGDEGPLASTGQAAGAS